MFFHARKVRTLPASFFQLPRYTFFVRLSCFKYIRLCARPQPRAPRRSRATRARRSRRPGSHRAQPCAACGASAPSARLSVAACAPCAPVPSVARSSRCARPSCRRPVRFRFRQASRATVRGVRVRAVRGGKLSACLSVGKQMASRRKGKNYCEIPRSEKQ